MVVRMRDVLAPLGRCYGVFTLLKIQFKPPLLQSQKFDFCGLMKESQENRSFHLFRGFEYVQDEEFK